MSNVFERARTGLSPERISPDLAYLRTAIANVYFYGFPDAGDRNWVLIDAGVHGSRNVIMHAASTIFGNHARPRAIVLTHGHFDHVGALRDLAREWDAPVYAHPLELPYITGRSSYPPPDPTVGGGAMSALSFLYPRGPFDIGDHARSLPEDGSVPGMEGWRWIATPGHSPGHVSFFREDDRTLIAGDAVTTTKQESATSVLTQKPEVHGPPAYFTCDWNAARDSVRRIAELTPLLLATGHGIPLFSQEMQGQLQLLAAEFDERARPKHGRYVAEPAVANERGVVVVPPPVVTTERKLVYGLGAAIAAGLILRLTGRGRQRTRR